MASRKNSVPQTSGSPAPTTERRRVALVLGLSFLLGVPTAVIVQSRTEQSSSPFQLIDITGVDYGKDFELPDQNGVVRSLEDFRGEVAVVFFGFTQCPDVCPTTMTEIAEAKKLMGAAGSKLRGIFITIDPERDTAEILKAYAATFDPGFVALRPAAQQVEKVANEFRIHVKKNRASAAGAYSFDHTAASFVFDPQGRLRLYARHGAGAAALAADARLLLRSAA